MKEREGMVRKGEEDKKKKEREEKKERRVGMRKNEWKVM